MRSSAMTWSADENMKKLSICFLYRFTSNKVTMTTAGEFYRRNPVMVRMSQGRLLSRLTSLGNAYRRAGRLKSRRSSISML